MRTLLRPAHLALGLGTTVAGAAGHLALDLLFGTPDSYPSGYVSTTDPGPPPTIWN